MLAGKILVHDSTALWEGPDFHGAVVFQGRAFGD